MSKLTEEQLRKYQADDGDICPFCGSDRVDIDDGLRTYVGRVEEDKLCLNCEEEWTDVYTRTAVY